MKIKKIIIATVCISVIAPAALYVTGFLTQFLHSCVAWNADGRNFNTVPALISLKFMECLKALLDFPYSLIAFGLIAGAAIYLLYKSCGKNLNKNKGAGIDGNIKISRDHEHGSAEFLQGGDINAAFDILSPKNTVRDILGGYKKSMVICPKEKGRINGHIAVCGSSGSGKSRCISRNLIIQCARRGESIVATDPKGELYGDCAKYLEDKGYKVKVFNLSNMSASDSWDILGEVNGSYDRARILSSVIMSFTNNAGDSFWTNSEMNFLLSLILYASSPLTDVKPTMGSVYRLITENSENELNMRMRSLKTACDMENGYYDDSASAYSSYSIFAKGAENVRGNVITGIGSALQLFQSREVENITSYDEIDLTLPGREKCAYFCIVPDQHSAYSVLSSLFFTFLFIDLAAFADRQENRMLPVKVKFILDEFTNCCVIPEFEKKCSTVRSRGMDITIFYQTVGQLKNRYRDNAWNEILGACDTSILLGTDDNETAEYFSTKAGDTTVITESESRQENGEYRTAVNKARRKLLTPDEIQKLDPDEELIFVKGRNVMRAARFDYTKNPEYKSLVKTDANSHVPEWKMHQENLKPEYPVYTLESLREKRKQ